MSDMAAELQPRPFTVDEYHLAWNAGALGEDRVELIDGLIISMPPIGNAHWRIHWKLSEYLTILLAGRAIVVPQGSFPLDLLSEPQPDIAILSVSQRDQTGAVDSKDVLTVIEISDSSLRRDLGPKLHLYARSKIADYLVIDVARNILLHHTDPEDSNYNVVRMLSTGDTLQLSCLSGVTLEASKFLAR
jgi:Uma2 family endonuclease